MQIVLMENWTAGYTQSELDIAQERYGLRFPPDLIDLFLDRQPINGYNWKGEDHRIREMLAWPMDMLIFDVEHGSWWRDWVASCHHIRFGGKCSGRSTERTVKS